MPYFKFLIKKVIDYEISRKVVERVLFLNQLFIRTFIILLASWTLTWAGVYPVSLLYSFTMPNFFIDEIPMIAEGIVTFIILAALFVMHAISEKNENDWIF